MEARIKQNNADASDTDELTIEESFERLDAILEKMEDEETGLEESFRLYEEGMKLLKDLHERIEDYEKKMLVLNPDGNVEEFGPLEGSGDFGDFGDIVI